MKKTKINSSLFFPAYIVMWPLLFALVEVYAISFFKDTEFFLIDLRLIFYIIFFLLFVWKLTKGVSQQNFLNIFPIVIFGLLYLLSFLLNTGHEQDYKEFLNGFLLFSIMYVYVLVYRFSINWDFVVTSYSFAIIVITVFGFYSFLRFDPSMSTLSGGLSHQLWRLCGGKTVYIPSALILFMLFFKYQKQGKSNFVLNVAVILSLISLALSGQRTAIVFLAYFVITFSLYSGLRVKIILLLSFLVSLFAYKETILTFIEATFLNKIHRMSTGDALTRIDIWHSTLDALFSNLKYFFFGVGEGGLPSVSTAWPIASNNPHSMLFYFWTSAGLAGVVALLYFIVRLGVLAQAKRELYKISFYWFFVMFLFLGGFSFYADSVKSDFCNIGVIIVIMLLLKSDGSFPVSSNMQNKRYNQKLCSHHSTSS